MEELVSGRLVRRWQVEWTGPTRTVLPRPWFRQPLSIRYSDTWNMQKLPLPPRRPLALRPPEERAWVDQGTRNARRHWESVRRHGGLAERANALACLSGWIFDSEGPAAALRLSRRAHRLYQAVGDPALLAVSTTVLALRLLDAGHLPEALRQATIAQTAMASLAPEARRPGLLCCVGRDFLLAGHVAEAQVWLELALQHPAADERAAILRLLARALELQNKLPAARERQQEACAVLHQAGARICMAQAMLPLARLDLRLGRKWHAATLCAEVLAHLPACRFQAEVAAARAIQRLCGPDLRGHSLGTATRRGLDA